MKARWIPELDAHTREVVHGAVLGLALRVAGAAFTLLFSVLVGRLFGAVGSGLFFLALTVMTIATVFGRMGMDNSLVRFIAAHASRLEWISVRGVYRKAVRIALWASLVTAGSMALSASLLAERVFKNPSLTPLLRWMALAVLPVVLVTLYGQMLRGLKRVGASVLLGAAWIPAIACLLLAVLGRTHGVLDAVWAYVVAAWLTAGGAWWWWMRVTPQLSGVQSAFDTRELLRSSVPLLWVASMSMAMNWIATFALGVWSTVADVGIFNAASRFSFLIGFILVAVDNISAPKFAELHAAGDRAALARTARNTVRLMLVLAAPALLLVFALPGTIMSLFGPEFRQGGLVLVILAIAQAANVLAGSVGNLLMMSGHEVQVRDSNTIAAVTCLIAAVLLVPRYGATGAALAVTASLVARNVYEIMMVRRHLGIGILLISHDANE